MKNLSICFLFFCGCVDSDSYEPKETQDPHTHHSPVDSLAYKRFQGNWACACSMEYEDKDDYSELEISDSLYWLVTDFIGPNCDVQKVIEVYVDAYHLRADTLFENQGNDGWYIISRDTHEIFITGDFKCTRIFPTYAPSQWSEHTKDKIKEEFILRRDSSNCPDCDTTSSFIDI